MLPTRILLASDGSEEAAQAARTAIELSEKLGAELHLVYVGHMRSAFYESPGVWALDPELQSEMEERMEEEAITGLEEEVQSIREAGGKVAQAHAKVGRPDAEIVKLAEELGADLIVVGSRGLGALKRALMGSVSESVLHHAHASVLVARGEPISFPTKILVATDGSEEAALAASTAADIAGRTGSELHVVYVEPALPPYWSMIDEFADPGGERTGPESRRRLDEQVRRIEEAGGTVAEAHLRLGRPDDQIVRLAEEIGAGLVVAGSRGLGPLKHALLGSVSGSVVRHAYRSVLVVREEE